MSESYIDNHRTRFDPAFDSIMTFEQSRKLHMDRINYELKEWHRNHDAPEPGYEIDGYPLMRGESHDAP